LFDEGDEADAAVLGRPCDPHGRPLYLYLEQEYPRSIVTVASGSIRQNGFR
jgi:hypothetical protein